MWVSMAIIVVGTEICALALILIRRWRQERPRRYHKSPIAGDIFGVIGTGFAVILAFVIFTAFESYQKARNDTGIESVATRQMYALAPFFTQPNRDVLQGDLICYSRAVVNDEWPLMATGERSPLVDGWVDQMDRDIVALPVQTAKEIEAFNTWFARSTERQDGRRGRLADATPYVPPFVWAMLVLLFVVVVGYQVLFVSPKTPLIPQVLGVSAVAATMLAGIVVVYVLDAPFADRGAQLSPFRMQTTLVAMEGAYQANPATIRCDEAGRPITR
ncbi:MAG: hypothetical protein ABJA74_06440 [Lapillicoccus sp.]